MTSTQFLNLSVVKLNNLPAEHFEEGAHHSGLHDNSHRFIAAQSVDEVDDDSESDNGEFITIKVTNEQGKTEAEEVDHIKEHKERKELKEHKAG